MEFSKSVLPLGEGRVCHARKSGESIEILSRVDGGVTLKRVSFSPRSVASDGIVSFAEWCCFCPEGILEKSGYTFSKAAIKQNG